MSRQISFEEFSTSLEAPKGIGRALLALWHDERGDWETAHAMAQEADGADGAWVHAYLHRKEGDESNALYWYSRAGRPAARGELRAEWEGIVRELLGRGAGR